MKLGAPSGSERIVNTARDAVRSAQTAARWMFDSQRPLPNFVIIGAQRCGTTSLFEDLSAHPQILKPIGKELQFFTKYYHLGERWYRSQFPHLRPGQQTFEATPYYSFHPDVPPRAAATLPESNFILLLRDPVARAYSHYLHSRNLGVERLTFEEALDAEPARLAEADRLGLNTRTGRNLHQNFSYVSRGIYAPQLERWLAQVPEERFKVVRSEDFYENPDDVHADVLSYLGLPPWRPQHFKRANAQASEWNAVRMAPPTHARLCEQFEADGQQVNRMLGWQRSWH